MFAETRAAKTMGSRLHVDLRSELLPPRDQGVRPTCLAFAATAAHEYARQLGSRLCVEYLYFIASGEMVSASQPAGLTLAAVGVALRDRGQPAESVWPYHPSGPTPPSPPANLGPLLRCTQVVHDTPEAVITCVAGGVPVVLALEITNVWYTDLAPDYLIDDEAENSTARGSVGHAVLANGVREDDLGNPVLLVQNSWGDRWADNGCAWLSWDYLKRHFLWGMIVGELL